MNTKVAAAALILVFSLAAPGEAYAAGLAAPSAPLVPFFGTAGAYGAGQDAAAQTPSYNPAGRRDPFKNLFGGKDIKERRGVSGPADLQVEEIQVVGIIKSKSGYKALIAMIDGFPLTAREGDKFADGYIVSIREGEIVFRKTTERGIPLIKPRDIVRDIISEER